MKLGVSRRILLATAIAGPLSAGTAPIGIVSAIASYSLNDSSQTGAASIASGTTVATTTAPSDIRLDNGAELRLGTRSSATVYDDHLALNEGAVRLGSFTDYSVNFHNLQVVADSPAAQAIVRVHNDRVEVASLGGSVRVSDGGAMMTRVGAGTKATFQAQNTSSRRSRTGASPADRIEERNTLLWTVVGVSSAALVIGGIAAYQGKSPF